MKCLGHRKVKRALKASLLERDLRMIDPKVSFLTAQKPINYFSSEGMEVSPRQIQQTRAQPDETYETGGDSKYGIAVFEASQTELSQDPNDSVLDLLAPEEFLAMNKLCEETEAPYKTTEEEVLEKMGMHIVDLDEYTN